MGISLTNTNQGGYIRVLRTSPGIRNAESWCGYYLLDSFPGAIAAYSLRKLRKNYNGPAIRVRRDSDNAETDIGFTGNGIGPRLDERSLSSFVGSANGFVTIWYDQSGNNVHQARTIQNQQPQIVLNGTTYVDNGRPALWFNGSMSMRSIINVSLTSVVGEWSSFGVSRNLDFSIARVIFSYDGILGDFVSPRIGQFMRVVPSGATQAIGFRSDYTFVTDSGPNVGSNQAILNTIRRVNSIEIFANNVSNGASSLVGSAQTGIIPLDIGYRGGINFSVFQPVGYIQELIHYPSDATSFYRDAIKGINHYYKVY